MASPLDWPQMWQKPSCEVLVAALDALGMSPPTWNSAGGPSQPAVESPASRRKGEATRYLSSIIKSPLAWIDEDRRERVWELASRRMAERCGRTAMNELVRRWPFAAGPGETFELTVREPALTGDSLGLKTWASSYVLARHLPRLAASVSTPSSSSSSSLFKLFDESLGQPRPSVLELGSGTGLLGLAAAALWRVPVALSDLPGIVPNLKHNVHTNDALVTARGGSLTVGPLTWGGGNGGEEDVDQGLFGVPFQFKVNPFPPSLLKRKKPSTSMMREAIPSEPRTTYSPYYVQPPAKRGHADTLPPQIVLAADPLYDDNHPGLLASAIGQHLALGSDARAVVMVPRRDATTSRLLEAFRQAMLDLEAPLFCDEEDELVGQDDWVDDDEAGAVRCWLGVFSRGGTPASFCC